MPVPLPCSPDGQIPIASMQLHLSVQFLCTVEQFMLSDSKESGFMISMHCKYATLLNAKLHWKFSYNF